MYRDEESQADVPVLMAAASKEQLFEVFMDLLDPLGSEVDVVLETSHNRQSRGHVDLYREHIDLPVLKSILWDYEDLLLNDGCTGIAVLNPARPAGSAVRRAQAADRLRPRPGRVRAESSATGAMPLRRQDEVHHRGRARPLVERALLPAVRGAENAPGHGLELLRSSRA